MAAGQPREIDPILQCIYNGTGSTLSQGYLVKTKAASTIPEEVVLAAAATDAIKGPVYRDVLDGQYGECVVGGVGLVIGLGAVAVGSRVTYGAGAKGTVAASGNSFCGVAQTLGAADTLFEVLITSPGGPEAPA